MIKRSKQKERYANFVFIIGILVIDYCLVLVSWFLEFVSDTYLALTVEVALLLCVFSPDRLTVTGRKSWIF